MKYIPLLLALGFFAAVICAVFSQMQEQKKEPLKKILHYELRADSLYTVVVVDTILMDKEMIQYLQEHE